MANMEYTAIYRERVPFRFMSIVAVFLGVLALGSLGLFVLQYTRQMIDSEPAVAWVFLGDAVLMGAGAILVRSLRNLDVIVTYDGLIVGFGRFRRSIPWADIESYRVVTERSLLDRGGWRMGLGRSGWYSAYTVIGKPRIVLTLRAGKIREVVFSTTDPEALAKAMDSRLGSGARRDPIQTPTTRTR